MAKLHVVGDNFPQYGSIEIATRMRGSDQASLQGWRSGNRCASPEGGQVLQAQATLSAFPGSCSDIGALVFRVAQHRVACHDLIPDPAELATVRADHPGVLVACLENESQDRPEAFELLRAQVPLTVELPSARFARRTELPRPRVADVEIRPSA
jgi:hypothetical protein